MPELFIDDIRLINSNLLYDGNNTFKNCARVVQRVQVRVVHKKILALLTDVAPTVMAVSFCANPSNHMNEKEKSGLL